MSDTQAVEPFNQKKRQLLVQFLGAATLVALLVSGPTWNDATVLHQALDAIGVLLILVCMFGRLWSTLYVGTRKNSELVVVGPYSVTRNPLYLFSTIGVFGLGAVFGSILVAFALAGVSYLVFAITAKKEAVFLRSEFGPAYIAYEARTPRFWPDFRLYHTPSEMTFSPRVLQRAFGDALLFVALIPIIEGVEMLQAAGYLPVFFKLP